MRQKLMEVSDLTLRVGSESSLTDQVEGRDVLQMVSIEKPRNTPPCERPLEEVKDASSLNFGDEIPRKDGRM